MKKLLNNKWTRGAIPALLIHCSIGTIYCWSSFSSELASQLSLSSSATSWAFSVAIFILGMAAAFAGKYVERDIHKSSLIACVLFVVGMAGTGLSVQLAPKINSWALLGVYLFYGLIMGVGVGVGYLTPIKTLMLWFSENKGLATGISIMGFGLAKAIASPLMNSLVVKFGLAKMFYILAVVYFFVMLLGHFLLKKPESNEDTTESDIKLKNLIKDKTFVGLWLMFFLNVSCGLALIATEKPILTAMGVGVGVISTIQALTAGSNALGRLAFSTISDKLKDRNTVYKVIFALSIIACALMFATRAVQNKIVLAAAVTLVLINACYGGGFSTMPALVSSRYGMKDLNRVYGFVLSAWGFAGLTGNQISTLVYQKTGSYEIVFACLCVIYAVGMTICSTMIKKKN